jgi:hypothetical protein
MDFDELFYLFIYLFIKGFVKDDLINKSDIGACYIEFCFKIYKFTKADMIY